MRDASVRPWLTASAVLLAALALVLVRSAVDTRHGLVTYLVVLTVLILAQTSAAAHVSAISIAVTGLLAWLSLCGSCFYGETLGRSWWPWLTVQPFTTLMFVCSLVPLLMVRDDDLTRVRLATAVTAAGIATFYGFGADYVRVTRRPWEFEMFALSAPALLALLPLGRWPRGVRIVYTIAEPHIIALGCWLVLVPSLKARESSTLFLVHWFWRTFALPCTIALAMRSIPLLLPGRMKVVFFGARRDGVLP
ncbi:MAG: hypothetical protein ACYC7A_22050 [Thermoanaerobaculia bacterium]